MKLNLIGAIFLSPVFHTVSLQLVAFYNLHVTKMMTKMVTKIILTAIESIFDKNVDDIFGSDGTSFEKCKSTLHEHNQGTHYQQEKLKFRLRDGQDISWQ